MLVPVAWEDGLGLLQHQVGGPGVPRGLQPEGHVTQGDGGGLVAVVVSGSGGVRGVDLQEELGEPGGPARPAVLDPGHRLAHVVHGLQLGDAVLAVEDVTPGDQHEHLLGPGAQASGVLAQVAARQLGPAPSTLETRAPRQVLADWANGCKRRKT